MAPVFFLLSGLLAAEDNVPRDGPWQALAEGRKLTASDAAKLEKSVTGKRPEPWNRARLLAYYAAQSATLDAATVKERRATHLTALFESARTHAPALDLGCAGIVVSSGDPLADAALHAQLAATWPKLIKAEPDNLLFTRLHAEFLYNTDQAGAIRAVGSSAPVAAGDLAALAYLGIMGRDIRTCEATVMNPAAGPGQSGKGLNALVESAKSAIFLTSFATTVNREGARLHRAGKITWNYAALANKALELARGLNPEEASCLPEVTPPGPSDVLPERDAPELAGPLTQRKPTYPPKARTMRITGRVYFDVRVGCTGKVIWLGYAQGPVELQQAAGYSLAGWTYPPPMFGTQATQATTVRSVGFSLSY